jgi:hypothetical protein
MLNNCRSCGSTIEPERLEVLPSTVICSACAHKHNVIKPRKGIMTYSHKTGGEIQIMSADFYDKNKRYFIPDGARSVVKNFSKSICS